MNKRIRILDRLLGIALLGGILAVSIGREAIGFQLTAYTFWLTLGLYLGFQLYKYEIKRMWKKESHHQDQRFDINEN